MEWRLRSVDGRRGDLVDPWDLGWGGKSKKKSMSGVFQMVYHGHEIKNIMFLLLSQIRVPAAIWRSISLTWSQY